MAKDQWNEMIAEIWEDDSLSDADRIRVIDELAATRPFNDALALFERGGARDAAGLEEEAVPLYLAALRGGLPPSEHVQALIQLASSYRNIGMEDEAVALLEDVLAGRDVELRSEVEVFLALSYYSAGKPEKALALLMRKIAPTLDMYTRSVNAYADELDAISEG